MEPIKMDKESIISHHSTPNGNLVVMEMGEVSGIIDNQKDNGPSGFSSVVILPYMAIIMGKIG